MSQERHQVTEAAPVAWAELEALAAQVEALGERVRRLEVGTDDGQPVGESSPPNHVTKTDDHPARTRTSGKPWAVIRTPVEEDRSDLAVAEDRWRRFDDAHRRGDKVAETAILAEFREEAANHG